jgi:hypothetical protein
MVLEKVRNYIRLNQDYLGFIQDQESAIKPDSESMEIDHESQV